MKVPRYRKHVAWSEEDHAWIATSPDFPGISAAAASDAKALAELVDLLAAAIEEYGASGWPLPTAESLQSGFSGQLRLRLPRSLHAAAVRRAGEEGVSLNSFLQCTIAHGLGERSKRVGAGNRPHVRSKNAPSRERTKTRRGAAAV